MRGGITLAAGVELSAVHLPQQLVKLNRNGKYVSGITVIAPYRLNAYSSSIFSFTFVSLQHSKELA